MSRKNRIWWLSCFLVLTLLLLIFWPATMISVTSKATISYHPGINSWLSGAYDSVVLNDELTEEELTWLLSHESMRDLNLGQSHCAEQNWQQIANLMRLIYLRVSCVDPNVSIHVPKSLKVLTISDSHVTASVMRRIQVSNVVMFGLVDCVVTSECLSLLAGMPQLEVISIIDSQIIGHPPSSFMWSKRIVSVSLNGSKFERELLSTFGNSFDRKLLSLDRCQSSDDDMFLIEAIAYLSVRKTQVSRSTIKKWLEVHPGASVDY